MSKLSSTEFEAQKALSELAVEKQSNRKRHANLVDDLIKALQSKDAAFIAVKKLESLCIEAGYEHLKTYQFIEKELNSNKSGTESISQEAAASTSNVDSIMKSFSEVDREIIDVERQVKQNIKQSREFLTNESTESRNRSFLSSTLPTNFKPDIKSTKDAITTIATNVASQPHLPLSSTYSLPTTGRGSGSLRVGKTLPLSDSYIPSKVTSVSDVVVNDLLTSIEKGNTPYKKKPRGQVVLNSKPTK
jgi:hypothetical protein